MKEVARKHMVQSLHPDVVVTDSDIVGVEVPKKGTLTEPPILIQHDPADDVIYSPGVMGFPSSDLTVSRRELSDPSLMIAVEQRMRARVDTGDRVEDSSEAFDGMKFRHESDNQYIERMKNFLRNSYRAHVAQDEVRRNIVEPKPE